MANDGRTTSSRADRQHSVVEGVGAGRSRSARARYCRCGVSSGAGRDSSHPAGQLGM